jgi:hypothetical protein
MSEREERKILKGDRDWQETCFALAKILSARSEEINPIFDFANHRSGLKRSALKAMCAGLINQNPAIHLKIH